MLAIRDLAAGYGDVQVLWGVDLEVGAGRTVALIGANGAGKTTLLRAVTGLLPIRTGSIEFEGRSIAGLGAERIARLGIAHVPEGRHLFSEMTVEENLIAGSLFGEARRRRAGSLGEVFETFPRLAERRRQFARTLSGGEQQMLALARGLMARPRLLILDEPSIGLAPKLVDEVFAIVRRLAAAGLTILLVEQNVPRTLAVADAATVLENGRVVLAGDAAELAASDAVRQAYLGLSKIDR